MEEDIVMLQEYLVHLLDGTVVRVSEDYDLPVEQSLITKIRKAKSTDVFSIGNPFDGYKYIPRSSILYVETSDVVEEDSMVRKLREGGHFPPMANKGEEFIEIEVDSEVLDQLRAMLATMGSSPEELVARFVEYCTDPETQAEAIACLRRWQGEKTPVQTI